MRPLVSLLFCAAILFAQQAPKPYAPTADEIRQIEAKASELADLLRKVENHPLYPDAAIYHKAARFIVDQPGEFANAASVSFTPPALANSPGWSTMKRAALW